jgi:hypothetical protein
MDTSRLPLLLSIVHQFAIYGEFEFAEPFGFGLINNIFRSQWNQAGTRVRYTHRSGWNVGEGAVGMERSEMT